MRKETKLKIGDIVEVYYEDYPLMKAYLRHTPAGPGDMWQVENIETGDLLLINPYNLNFIGITKFLSDNKEELDS